MPFTPIYTKTHSRLTKLIQNIAQDFDLDKLSKSPARFNTKKLDWFNQEYIKMLSLEEFCLRSFKLKLDRKFPDAKLRTGDHVYLVDIDKQMVFCETSAEVPGVEQSLHPVGGGRPANVNSIDNLKKEVKEETNDQIQIDETKLLKIAEFVLDEPFIQGRSEDGRFYTSKEAQKIKDHPNYLDGKDWTIYFYPIKISEIKPYLETDPDDGRKNQFDWVPLAELVGHNRYLTYPIYKEFCDNNDIACFEVTDRIKTQYLAWSLDKTRITTLSEFGLESDCILNYEIPDPELIKWKKITLEESIANLQEILPVLNIIYTKLESDKKDLMQSNINDLPIKLEKQAKLWESELKSWISENNKDAGSYFWPLRTTLSGRAKSPSPFELLAILEWKDVESRVWGIVRR